MTQNGPYPPQKPSEAKEKNFFQRNAFSVKLALIGILTLLLLIPLSMVQGLVFKRQQLSEISQEDITSHWSREQTLVGPVLSFTYRTMEEVTEGNNRKAAQRTVKKQIELLPDELNIEGDVRCTPLRRGIYEAIVYRSRLTIEGSFRLTDEEKNRLRDLAPERSTCRLSIGISDLRGLEKQVEAQWDEVNIAFASNNDESLLSGISATIDADKLINGNRIPFRIELELKGSNSLFFIPVGRTTSVSLKSDCPSPSFTGDFLPSVRQVHSDGFSCTWNILDMNRSYPQLFSLYERQQVVEQSSFGVELRIPVAQYQMSMRSTEYAILVILLIFVAMLFAESFVRKPLNPFQYLLIGLALILFYSLLTALSEHLSFGLSYLVAAGMTTAMLSLYSGAILRDKKAAMCIGAVLAAVYLYIFVLLQMETWALLAGSLGLFAILGGVMALSQKMNAVKKGRR